MDTNELDRLEALEKAATPGPWVTRFDGAVYREVVRGEVPVCEHASREEAAFIAALRNAAPALIAAAEERDELRKRAETAEKQEKLWREDASKQLGELAQANLALVSAHALLVRAGKAIEWVTPAMATLVGYERDYGETLPDDWILGRIEESRDTPSFRIRVGHFRRLAALAADLRKAGEGA